MYRIHTLLKNLLSYGNCDFIYFNAATILTVHGCVPQACVQIRPDQARTLLENLQKFQQYLV